MADFEPYPDLPEDDVPSDAALATSRGNARWAKTFEGGTTSLAQRARHAADIRQYTVDLESRRAAQQAYRLATDKDAQNFALRSRALDIQENKAAFDMWDKNRKAAAAAAMLPSILRAREAQTTALIANTERKTNEAELKNRITADADRFHAKVAQAAMLYPEGPDYDRAILAAASEHHLAARDPDAKPLIDAAKKAHATRAAQAEAERKAREAGMIPKTVTATGATTFAAPPAVKPPRISDPELNTLKHNLSGLEKDNKADTPRMRTLRERIAKRESELAVGQPQSNAPAAPAAPAPTRLKLVGDKLIQVE